MPAYCAHPAVKDRVERWLVGLKCVMAPSQYSQADPSVEVRGRLSPPPCTGCVYYREGDEKTGPARVVVETRAKEKPPRAIPVLRPTYDNATVARTKADLFARWLGRGWEGEIQGMGTSYRIGAKSSAGIMLWMWPKSFYATVPRESGADLYRASGAEPCLALEGLSTKLRAKENRIAQRRVAVEAAMAALPIEGDDQVCDRPVTLKFEFTKDEGEDR